VDIAKWLRALGLAQYEQMFHDNAIDIEVLADVTDADLVAMGIQALGHRKKLLRAISALRGAAGRQPDGQFPYLLGASDRDSERRRITVLFADLVNSTGLAGRLDPEDLRDVLRGYHNCCATLVQRFDGSVAQFQGDGIIAHFGYPRAHEDDARRAVRCGLSITEEVAQLQLPAGVKLAARVGVATGLVVVGDLIGTEQTLERAAVGSVPNIASRLQNLAGPSNVVIELTTRRAIADNFALEDLGIHAIKGVEQPTHVWRVLGEEASKLLEASRVAFAGRRSELQRCRDIITECRDAGRGQVIYVRGEPGIGKTRFVEEVMRAAETGGFASHRGVALDFGAGPTQDPIRSIIRSLLMIEPGDDLDSQRSALNSAMASANLPADDRMFLEALLGVPLGTSERSIYDAMDNDSRNRGKREVLTAIIERLTQRRECLVILEDLHWADASILSYATALVSGVRNVPALVIMTSRQDGDPLDAGWRATIGAIPMTTIDLGPLSTEDAHLLASAFVNIPFGVARMCVERGEGNPLFLEQLLRNAEERNQEAVPTSIQSIVLARMDRLSLTDKRVLQVASVLGQRFDTEVVCHLLREPVSSFRRLIAAGLLKPNDEAYLFTHALLRDAVYDTLLRTRRRELHREAANWFASRGDRVLRAQHLDRAEDAEASQAYLEAAQSQSAEYHYEAALQLVERGLSLAQNAAARFTLTCCKADILHDLGAMTDAKRAYESALDTAPGDVERCRTWIGLAAVKRVIDDLPGAAADLERAESVASAHDGLLAEQARIHFLRGNLCFPQGDFTGCLREHTRTLELARRAQAAELEALALGGLGDGEYMVGRMVSARNFFNSCIELCQRHGFGRIDVANRPMAAFTRFFSGDVRGALVDADDAIGAAVKVAHVRGEMISRHVACLCRREMLDFAGAWTDVIRALTLARQLGAKRFEAEALAFRGELHRLAGRHSQCLTDLASAIAIFRETGMAFMGPMALGLVALATEDAQERLRALSEAEALLDRGAVSHNHLLFRKDAIEACLEAKDWDQAEHHAAALATYTRQESSPWTSFFVARGQVLSAYGRGGSNSMLFNELARLCAEGERLGFLLALRAIERARAELTPHP
jgi:class 3 adenylate cyclase/tetratricopeptide (TPR) repeat protein